LLGLLGLLGLVKNHNLLIPDSRFPALFQNTSFFVACQSWIFNSPFLIAIKFEPYLVYRTFGNREGEGEGENYIIVEKL